MMQAREHSKPLDIIIPYAVLGMSRSMDVKDTQHEGADGAFLAHTRMHHYTQLDLLPEYYQRCSGDWHDGHDDAVCSSMTMMIAHTDRRLVLQHPCAVYVASHTASCLHILRIASF